MNRSSLLALTSAGVFAASASLNAQTVTWNGNASGNWVVGANWVGGSAPANTTVDVAGLFNVTSGTRIISINGGDVAQARSLAFTQTAVGAGTILSIATGGTLNLGGAQTWAAPTAGATSRVELGGLVNFTGITSGTVTVNNALNFTASGATFRSSSASASALFLFNGPVEVNAGASGLAQIAYTGATSTRQLNSTFGSASVLNVNSGTLEFSTTVTSAGAGTVVTNLQGTTFIDSDAAIRLSTPSSGSGSAGVTLTNSGTLTQAGIIATNGRGSSAANAISNTGTWIVSGGLAVIEKATNNSAQNPTLTNAAAAILRGNGVSSTLDYNHLQTPGTDLAFANNGRIQAGAGTGGSGLTSVGTLVLTDFATTLGDTSALEFDLGGTGVGEFDILNLNSGSLSLNGTLAITLVNGFTPAGPFSIDIITGDASLSGSFDNLLVNGVANSDYSFSFAGGVGTLTVVPEPSAAMLFLGGMGLWVLRARRRLA